MGEKPNQTREDANKAKSPVLEVPEKKRVILVQLLRENEAAWTRLKMDDYKCDEQKEVWGTKHAIMADILERLMLEGSIETWSLSKELEEKYEYYGPSKFNECCTAIADALGTKNRPKRKLEASHLDPECQKVVAQLREISDPKWVIVFRPIPSLAITASAMIGHLINETEIGRDYMKWLKNKENEPANDTQKEPESAPKTSGWRAAISRLFGKPN